MLRPRRVNRAGPSVVCGLALVFSLVLSAASTAVAGVAAIETTAPLEDYSEESIKAAVNEAVQTAARGALAMGLPWLHLRGAFVVANMVTVQVLATDVEPQEQEETERAPGLEPGRSGGPARLDL